MANIFKSMLSSIIARNMKKKLTSWTIHEEDITEVLKQIRNVLLDADVNLLVVTTIAKLAYWLKTKKNLQPLVVGLDVYRPAAIDQLQQLANKIDVNCYKELNNKDVLSITRNSLKFADSKNSSVILFDTAGRLQTNKQLMQELKDIKNATNPHEIILVVDAMSGQDIINVAKEFNDTLHITGLIITKLDSQARAGAVLSITSLLNIPVIFNGTGEAIGSLDVFWPNRMADQILGLGDVLTLAEKAVDKIDQTSSKKSFSRMLAGKFDLEDLLRQMEQINKLGSLGGIMKMMPSSITSQINDDQIEDVENKIRIWKIIMTSMTLKERRDPKLFKKEPNRKIRVIKGSGRRPDELNKMLSQWSQAKSKLEELGKKIKSGKNPILDLLKGNM